MAVLTFTGFETGISAETYQPGGTFSIQNSITNSGGYALRTNPTTTGTGYVCLAALSVAGIQNTDFGTNDLYSRFYFRVATLPATGAEEIYADYSQTSVQNLFSLRITSAGTIDGYNALDVKVMTGTTTLSLNTWYLLEIHTQKGASGVCQLKINGVSEWSGTANQFTEVKSIAILGKHQDRSGKSVDFYYDDFLASGTAFPGAGRCVNLVAVANGTYQAFTIGAGSGSHYQIVNEVPPDGNTSYLVSAASGSAETETVQTRAQAAISVSSVNSVKGIGYFVKDGATAGSCSIRVRSNTTDNDQNSLSAGASYTMWFSLVNTDPATATAWLPVGLDTLQVGVLSGSVNKSRLSAAYLHVDYAPSVVTFTPGLYNFNIGNGF